MEGHVKELIMNQKSVLNDVVEVIMKGCYIHTVCR